MSRPAPRGAVGGGDGGCGVSRKRRVTHFPSCRPLPAVREPFSGISLPAPYRRLHLDTKLSVLDIVLKHHCMLKETHLLYSLEPQQCFTK